MLAKRISLSMSIVFCGTAVLSTFSVVRAQDFSVDPLSPEVPGTFSPADGAPSFGLPPGFTIFKAVDIALVAGENVDAFSYGLDSLKAAGATAKIIFHYSVDRATVGVAGGVVNMQVTGDGAAGDAFRIAVTAAGVVVAAPVLAVNSIPTGPGGHGLTPGPGAGQSDVDGHSFPFGIAGPVGGTPGFTGVLFSVDPATAMSAGTRWGIVGDPAYVYLAPVPVGATPLVVPAIYATAAGLGLVAGDDIDALAVRDLGIRGTLDVGDIVYVSLAAGSPTLGTLGVSPASIIQVFPGPNVEVITPVKLGLLPTDELNALTAFDPDVLPALPQWGLAAMVVVMLIAGTIEFRRRRNRKIPVA